MAKIKGMRLCCDRCGKIEFVKCTGTNDLDGGYTKLDVYESVDGWDQQYVLGSYLDLCPDCSDLHKIICTRHGVELKKFMEGK